ncbi:MAG: enoyl-CoA hydratase/isomerase family protein [Candidatus Eremiobacteraeota bacterium]|nr:enoyl-CoA hydratase/isomerase family protein [Candidatus Eremiobacteraeota bacterium]
METRGFFGDGEGVSSCGRQQGRYEWAVRPPRPARFAGNVIVNEGIVVRSEAQVGHIRIERPEKKNALTTAMYDDMADALEWIAEDKAIRVVLISGGADFTAGNDLQDFIVATTSGRSFEDLPVLRFIGRLRDHPKPVIAAVRGHAIGIGTTMLLHCDAVVAASDARFRLPFVPLGLVPEAGSSLLLPLAVGAMRANWLLMSGEYFYADDAREMGLVTRVVEDEAVDSTAKEMAGTLAVMPPLALQETKRLLRSTFAQQVAVQMEEEARVFSNRLQSQEFRDAALKLLSR